MNVVRFGDVVKRVNINVDRFNTDRLYYVGKGGSIEPGALEVYPKALIKGATIGFKFHFGFNPGHILFMSRCFDQHKAATATFAGICSDSTYVVETRDENILSQRYLQLVMQSDHFWNWCEEHKSGGVNYLINYSTLNEYEFSLPPLSEQKVLAEKLWAAYEVKQSYLRMIAATEEMVKSQFVEMFGDKQNNSQIRTIATVVSGKSIPTSLEDIKGDIAYVKVGDFNIAGNEKYIKTSSRFVTEENASYSKLIPIDTVVFAKNGAASLSNKKRLTKIKCCIDMNTMAVIPDAAKVCPDFLLAILNSIDIASNVRQGAIPSISPKSIEDTSIFIPPMDLQQQFVRIAEQADKSVFELKKSIAAIDGVIKSLVNEKVETK